MISRRALVWVVMIVLAVGFMAVFIKIIEMRVSKGDIYPHYATYRNDPLGSSGLFDAFKKIPGFVTQRNTTPLMQIDSLGQDSVLLMLGVPRSGFGRIRVPESSPVARAIKERGARLVLTVDPVAVRAEFEDPFSDFEEQWQERRKEVNKKQRDTDQLKEDLDKLKDRVERETALSQGPRLTKLLGVDIERRKQYSRPEGGWLVSPDRSQEAVTGAIPDLLPAWHSPYRFELGGDDHEHKDPQPHNWVVMARCEGKPVIIERRWGKGSVAICSDSYFVSNEALYYGGDSDLLLWLMGGKSHLVFDETMHGSKDAMGTVKMLRQWRLHGILIGCLVFVLLWAWRSASSLAPGDEALDRGLIGAGGTVAGADANTGLISLLKRSIPSGELLDHCLTTWQASQKGAVSDELKTQIKGHLTQHKSNPREHSIVQTYKQIADLLKKH